MFTPLKSRKLIREIEGFLTDEDINTIHSLASTVDPIIGQTFGSVDDNGKVEGAKDPTRRCEIRWLLHDNKISWLTDKLFHVTEYVNNNDFDLDLTCMEAFQYTTYNAPGDKYGPHIDSYISNGVQRKLTFIIQLDHKESYHGGEVLLYPGNFHEPWYVSGKKGSITFFHSNIIHEATPVLAGTRKALIGWVSGPHFR